MTIVLDDIKALLESIHKEVIELPNRITVGPQQVTIVQGLSEISQSLGLVLAGEFRVGNQKPPGSGFTGVRMAYPGMTYSSSLWNIVGVNNDVLQFGLSAADGKAYAGAGSVLLGSEGVSITYRDVAGQDAQHGLTFWNPTRTTEYGGWYATLAAGVYFHVIQNLQITGTSAVTLIRSQSPAGQTASVILDTLEGATQTGRIEVTKTSASANVPIISTGGGGGAITSGLQARNSFPSFGWQESDQAADNQWWDASVSAKVWQLRVVNDANTSAVAAITVTRGSGVAVSTIALNAQVNVSSVLRLGGITTSYMDQRRPTLADTVSTNLFNVTGTGAGTLAMVLVINESSGASGLFLTRGGANAVDEIADPSLTFWNGDAGVGTRVFYSGGEYYIRNSTGASVTYTIYIFSA